METIKSDIINSISNGHFFEIIYNLENQDIENLDKILIELHNKKFINVIELYSELENRDNNFFSYIHLFNQILPFIVEETSSVMMCIKNLTLECGEDMCRGSIIDSFIKFLKNDTNKIEEVLSQVSTSVGEKFDFITPAIVAGSDFDLEKYTSQALKLAFDENLTIRIQAIFALGRIYYKNNNELIINVINNLDKATKKYHKNVFEVVLKTISNLIKQSKQCNKKAKDIINRIIINHDDLILHTASEMLSFNDELHEDIIDKILESLTNVKPENIGTLEKIDLGLYKIANNGQVKKTIEFLEIIIIKNSEDLIKNFKQSQEVLHDHLNYLVTKWLFSNNYKLSSSIQLIMRNFNDKVIKYDESIEKGCDYVLLSKRICGWLFEFPISCVSFILSFVDKSSKDELNEIKKILFNPLLISYPSKIKNYMDSIYSESSEIETKLIECLYEELKKYHSELKSVENIRELQPSIQDRESYYRSINQQMTETYKDVYKSSIANLFPTSIILYGNSSIYYAKNFNGEEQRQNVKMQSFKTSVEIPALEYLDPHNLNILLHLYRIEGISS